MKGLAYVVFGVLAAAFCVCEAAPMPAIVQDFDDWTLEVSFEHPQQIVLNQSRGNQPKRFWYTIVTLTNTANKDVDFYPKCDLMTDTFQILPAGKSTPPIVFEQIKRRHQGIYPFLGSLEKAGNRILQGSDNTVDIAVIWPDFDAKARNIKLFITGLSNETTVIDHPVAKDRAGNPQKIFLRKTLELSYKIGGEARFRTGKGLVYEGKRWVMR